MYVVDSLLKKLLSFKSSGLVLAAHGVSTTQLDPFLENVHIFQKDFVEVIEFLERMEVEFVDYEKMKAYLSGEQKAQKTWVHITFDDGYKNNLNVVLPILKEKGISFTVFVSSFHVESQKLGSTYYPRFLYALKKDLQEVFNKSFDNYQDYETYLIQDVHASDFEAYIDKMISMMSEEEHQQFSSYANNQFLTVKELQELTADPLVSIASHSHHHVAFHSQQDPKVLKKEVETSFEKFKNWGVEAKNSFCYPNGVYSKDTVGLLRELGVETAFVSDSGVANKNTDPLEIPRFWISSQKRMRAILSLFCMGSALVNCVNKLRA